MTEHVCPTCERPFETRRGLRVHHWRSHGERLPNRSCAHCDAEFYAEHERRYCSEPCRRRNTSYGGANNPNYRGGKTSGTCLICGTRFEYYPSEKPGQYCSDCAQTENWQDPPQMVGEDNPRWKGGKQPVDCVVCGTTVERYPSNIRSVTVCSESCRATWLSDAFSGPGHPNWRGGGNEAYGNGWKAVREQALERDSYQCRVCGTTRADLGRNPDVHHIVPVRWFIQSDEHTREDAHELANVISLCSGCHRKAEFEKIPRSALRALAGVTTD